MSQAAYMTVTRWLAHFKSGKPVYCLADLCRLSNLSVATMRRAAQRLVQQGLIARTGPGLYLNRSAALLLEDLSLLLCRPCYVSLESALFEHHVVSQAPQVLTCVTTRTTRHLDTPIGACRFQHLKPGLFFGYHRQGQHFIADPEKAALDLIYLRLKNGKPISTDEWDWARFSMRRIKQYAQRFPQSVQTQVRPPDG